MTRTEGFRGDAGCFTRWAAHVVAAALIVITMLTILWAGQAASAGVFRAQSRASASPSPARVKYYIVPPATSGHAQSLFVIAQKTLGDGSRFMEIFTLNKGRLQPSGGRLENPRDIFPGWILQLPADASGPRVRFGRLPVQSPQPASSASRRPSPPSRPVEGGASAPHFPIGWAAAGIVILAALTFAGIAGRLIRRRPGAGTSRRGPSHAKAPGPKASLRALAAATTALDSRVVDPSWPAADYPSGPAAGPGWAEDHPSFPGGSYPGSLGPDHPSWPGADQASWPRAIGRSAEPRPESSRALQHDTHRHAGSPDGGLSRAVLIQAPRTGRQPAAGAGGQLAVGQMGELVDPIRQQVEDLWNADSVRLTERMLAEADDQAAKIVTTAELEAAEIRRFAADRAAATLTTAEREAAELRATAMKMTAELGGVAAYVVENLAIPAKPATGPAAWPSAEPVALPSAEPVALPSAEPVALPSAEPAARPAAKPASRPEQDATRNLTKPAKPAIAPVARPAAKPASRPEQDATQNLTKPAKPATAPAARPTAKPAARPGVSPRRTPKARPATKPKGRQVGAWHKMVAALVVLLLVGVTGAAAEIELHGFSFFVFRDAGAGAGNSRNLNEDQGPGQSDAPGSHHKANVSKPSGKAGGGAGNSK